MPVLSRQSGLLFSGHDPVGESPPPALPSTMAFYPCRTWPPVGLVPGVARSCRRNMSIVKKCQVWCSWQRLIPATILQRVKRCLYLFETCSRLMPTVDATPEMVTRSSQSPYRRHQYRLCGFDPGVVSPISPLRIPSAPLDFLSSTVGESQSCSTLLLRLSELSAITS
jgi:hypothetical protein